MSRTLGSKNKPKVTQAVRVTKASLDKERAKQKEEIDYVRYHGEKWIRVKTSPSGQYVLLTRGRLKSMISHWVHADLAKPFKKESPVRLESVTGMKIVKRKRGRPRKNA